ncbi:MAG: RNA polymerase sigma factor [Acidobacteriota bacterium]
MSSEYSDNELIEAAKGGDEDAFGQIMTRYRDPLTNYLFRMLGDYEEAVDLAQESFVRVYFALGRYTTDFAFSTYIYRIATNLAISEIRKRKRRQLFSLTAMFDFGDGDKKDFEPADSRPDAAEDVSADEQSMMIAKAVASLPEKYRAPVILRDIQELSYEEISEALGLGMGTIKSRISRGRSILREKLERYLK